MRAASQILSQEDIQRIYSVISHAWRDSTKETYGSGLLVFHTFCDIRQTPEDLRAPASKDLISAFVVSMAGTYAAPTITNYINGVHNWHIVHGLPWDFVSAEASALLKAAKTLAPTSSKRPPRELYTIDNIIMIREQLSLTLPLDAAVFACLTTLFFATARTGEFTVPNLNSFNPSSHITRNHVSTQRDRNGLEITNFRLPRTKSAPLGEDVNWAKQDGPSDPQEALLNHFLINDPPGDAHLFAYKEKNGHKPLTRNKFLKTLETANKRAGLIRLKGHRIRIGSTLEYLLHNIPFEVVKVKGRWASDAFLIYLRNHAQILAPYMQANHTIHKKFRQFTIPPIRR